jgi:hypothetical protein
MQYGGALIAYLSVVDAVHVESTFDLLSLCRNPVLIVDSDLREDPVGRTQLGDALSMRWASSMKGINLKAGLNGALTIRSK